MITESLNILVNADTKAAQGKLNNLKSMVSGMTLFGGVALLKESVDAWEEQAEAVQKVDSAVKTHRANMQGHHTKDLENIASHTQSITTYGDEATLVADENFLTFGMTYDQIEKIQEPMADLIEHQKGMHAGGEDFLGVSNQIGKAWVNGASALKKTGTITDAQAKKIDKITDKNKRLQALTKAIEENYGGQARAIAKTDVGKVQQMKNDFGDQLELIGKKLIPYLAKAATWVDKNLDLIIKVGTAFAAWKISSSLFGGLRGLQNQLVEISAAAGGKMVAKGGKLGKAGKGVSKTGKVISKAGGVAAGAAGVVGAHQVGGWGGVVSGAASGAVLGAELGSMIPIPGVGSGIGAAVGGVGGAVYGGWEMISHNVLNLDGKEVAKSTSKAKKVKVGNAKHAK